jgi:hypothetical protein
MKQEKDFSTQEILDSIRIPSVTLIFIDGTRLC